ncbi:SDR family oxidoreductase [Jiella endophytica]|uniref:SDR family oxidoreductase n=1 Tax=Jiella endophytica TaxID=2558362 RepID=A0A4Y8RU33_9HYPH|nr:SDR family oxidoreductase [Jiella endophytica]TFF27696.1 SDR family oxidoreductase [Jiella endophytica]
MSGFSTIAILGAAGGIGRRLLSELRDRGHETIALDLPASLERHRLEGRSIAIDILDEASIENAFGELAGDGEGLDGFVNLAGYNARLTPLAAMDTGYFDDVIAGNLRGAFLAARAAKPLLERGRNASLVMVSSGLAAHVRPGYGAYSAAKAAIVAMTKTLALEWAPTVRVNAVAPGLVDTAFLRGGTGRSDEDGASVVDLDAYRGMTPLGRIALPDDVTGPVRFLLGEDSRFMTGQVLWVNGGGYMP